MKNNIKAFIGAHIFDGRKLLVNHALLVDGEYIKAVCPVNDISRADKIIKLQGGILAPGFVDLQVNGGGGIMFNSDPSLSTLQKIAAAHAKLGTTSLLPTLITDSAQISRAAIKASIEAVKSDICGIAGLHLEGPHISKERKGAHDPSFIRPMEKQDLELLLKAKDKLPILMVTIAPENVTIEQVNILSKAGIIVALGHTNADYETCLAYIKAGASCATHLFNAMSQLQNREPGLVGAALNSGEISAGIIADAIHVHPDIISLALRAKIGPGNLFLVSDAMAVAGTNNNSFTLNGRKIIRQNGRLTLNDGTLAGADLELAAALRLLVNRLHLPKEEAFKMATSYPAALAKMKAGHLAPGRLANFIYLDENLNLLTIWQKAKINQNSPLSEFD